MLLRWLKRLLLSIGLLWVIVTFTPVCDWWIHALAGGWMWKDAKGDVMIVPGAETVQDMIGFSSYWRSVYAARTWKSGGFREIVLTGGPSVAMLMHDFLICQGIPSSAIRVETRSTNTHENALFTKELLAGTNGRLVLLTSDYHMFRAYRAFRNAGLAVEPHPFPDARKQYGSRLNRWGVFQSLCGETTKIAYYFVRGWL